jgi:hypothetical protein
MPQLGSRYRGKQQKDDSQDHDVAFPVREVVLLSHLAPGGSLRTDGRCSQMLISGVSKFHKVSPAPQGQGAAAGTDVELV